MRWEGRKLCEIDVFMMTTRRGQVITATWKVFPFKRCQKVGKWHYNSQRRRTGGAGSGSGKKENLGPSVWQHQTFLASPLGLYLAAAAT